MKQEKIILESDVILPEKESIEVYNIGTKEKPHYILLEARARKELSTHIKCECGNTYEKKSYCSPCADKRSRENYFKKPFMEWDGEVPVCYDDTFFFDIDSIEEYLEENELEPEDLRLVICKPNHFWEISEDYWSDIFPENWDSIADGNKKFSEKLEEFNKFIREQPAFSWGESHYRTEYRRE